MRFCYAYLSNRKGVKENTAIYHCSIKFIKRSQGRSTVAAVAYRSGEKLTNEWDGITHDNTKKGGIVHSEIILPTHAKPELFDRSTLWNSVEKIEKSRNAQLAREIEIALPGELDRYMQIKLVRAYVRDTFVISGMCADFSIHDKGEGNPHVHILLTLRPLKEKGISSMQELHTKVTAMQMEYYDLRAARLPPLPDRSTC